MEPGKKYSLDVSADHISWQSKTLRNEIKYNEFEDGDDSDDDDSGGSDNDDNNDDDSDDDNNDDDGDDDNDGKDEDNNDEDDTDDDDEENGETRHKPGFVHRQQHSFKGTVHLNHDSQSTAGQNKYG